MIARWITSSVHLPNALAESIIDAQIVQVPLHLILIPRIFLDHLETNARTTKKIEILKLLIALKDLKYHFLVEELVQTKTKNNPS